MRPAGRADNCPVRRRVLVTLGLFLVGGCRAEPVLRGTTIIEDTDDRRGPYPVLAQVDDADGVDRVTLQVRVGDLGEAPLPMTEIVGGLFRGLIPGQPPFTRVRYFIEVVDGDLVLTDPPAARAAGTRLFTFWVRGSDCRQDAECGPGEHCDESRRCRQRAGPCSVDGDCGKGFRCGPLQTCLLAARDCQHDEGCLLGELCDRMLGQCVPRPGCSDGLSCPPGLGCVEATGACVRSCLGPADCGPGELCASGRCTGARPCAGQGDCPAGLACDPLLKICRLAGAGLCAPCASDADCGGPGDFCLLLESGMFCGRDCTATPCPAGYTCSSSLTPPQCRPESGLCPP
jgi:hypothetical protein